MMGSTSIGAVYVFAREYSPILPPLLQQNVMKPPHTFDKAPRLGDSVGAFLDGASVHAMGCAPGSANIVGGIDATEYEPGEPGSGSLYTCPS